MSASENLPSEFSVNQIPDVEDLYAIFTVNQSEASADLLGVFAVRHPAASDLSASFVSAQASVDLLASFRPTQEVLPAEFFSAKSRGRIDEVDVVTWGSTIVAAPGFEDTAIERVRRSQGAEPKWILFQTSEGEVRVYDLEGVHQPQFDLDLGFDPDEIYINNLETPHIAVKSGTTIYVYRSGSELFNTGAITNLRYHNISNGYLHTTVWGTGAEWRSLVDGSVITTVSITIRDANIWIIQTSEDGEDAYTGYRDTSGSSLGWLLKLNRLQGQGWKYRYLTGGTVSQIRCSGDGSLVVARIFGGGWGIANVYNNLGTLLDSWVPGANISLSLGASPTSSHVAWARVGTTTARIIDRFGNTANIVLAAAITGADGVDCLPGGYTAFACTDGNIYIYDLSGVLQDTIPCDTATKVAWTFEGALPSFDDLKAGFITRPSASADLAAEFDVGQDWENLPASFDGQVSLNLLGEFIVRQAGSEDLKAVFEVGQDWENLPAEFRLLNYPRTIGPSTVAASGQNPIPDTYWRGTFYVHGKHFVVYGDGAGVSYKYSSDGISWSAPVTVRAALPWPGEASHMSTHFDGRYLHYAMGWNGWNQPLRYRRGEINPDGSISWSAAEQVADAADPNYLHRFVRITVDSEGCPAIAYLYYGDVAANRHPYVTKSSRNDGVWATEAGHPHQLSAVASGNWEPLIISLGSKRLCAAYHTTGFYNQIFDGSNWGAEEGPISMAQRNASIAPGPDSSVLLSYDRQNDAQFRKRTWGVGWGGEVKVFDDAPQGNSNVIASGPDANTIYIFQFSNWSTIYEDQIIYAVSLDGGATWEGKAGSPVPQLWIDSETAWNNWNFSSSYRTWDGIIGFVWALPSVDVRYAALGFWERETLKAIFEVGQDWENLPASFTVAQAAEDLPASFDGQVSLNLHAEFVIRDSNSEDLLGIFTIRGSASEDLLAGFMINYGSEELLGIFDIRQVGSSDLLGIFDSRQTDVANLLGIFEGQATQDLLGIFTARHDGSEDLACEFEVSALQDASEDFFSIFNARHADSEELLGIFSSRRTASAELLGIFTTRRGATQELLGIFTIRGSASEDLLAIFDGQVSLDLLGEFVSRQAASEDLLGEFIARRLTSEELLGIFTVRHDDSEDLLAIFDGQASLNLLGQFNARHGALADLLGIFEAQHAASANLLGVFTARRDGSEELLASFDGQVSLNLYGQFNVRHVDSVDLPGEFIVRHAASEELLGIFSARHAGTVDLPGLFIIRHGDSGDLLGIFSSRHAASQDLLGVFIVRHLGLANLPGEVVVRHSGLAELLGEFVVRHVDTQDLPARFYAFTLNEELLGTFIARHSTSVELSGEVVVRHSSLVELYGEFIIRRDGSAEFLGLFNVRHSDAADLYAEVIARHDGSVDLFGRFYGFTLNEELLAVFVARHHTSADLLGEFIARQSDSVDLFSELVVRHDGTVELSAEFIVRHDGSVDLPGEFVVRHSTSIDLLANFGVAHWERLLGVFAVRHPYPFWTDRRWVDGVVVLGDISDAFLEEIISGVMDDVRTWLIANEAGPYTTWTDIDNTPMAIRRATTYGVVASLYARNVFGPQGRVVVRVPPVDVRVFTTNEAAMEYWEGLMTRVLELYLSARGIDRIWVDTVDEDPIFSMDDIPLYRWSPDWTPG